MVLAGCGTTLPDEPTPVDVVGTWSADFLVNTTTASVGDDVSHFGDLTMKASTYQSSSNQHVGNVELKSVIYAAQGSIQNPKMDAEGKPLAEAVGTALYAGTWTSNAYDGNTCARPARFA